jgi:predicted acylesterase/phospholipase RssA
MRVLILGGGGTLGAFSAGALRALEERGLTFDAFIGSSAGAINLQRWLVGGPEEAIRFWCDVARFRTILRGILHGRNFREGILDAPWFRARVEEGVDFEAMHHERGKPTGGSRKVTFAFLVVDLKTGRVSVRGNHTEDGAEQLRACARGAYALPPLLPPVVCGNELLADGGLLHNAPLQAAVKLGATEIIYLCNVHALPHAEFSKTSTIRSAWRYAEIFFRRASNVGFVDEEIVEDRYRGVRFLAITPPASLRFASMLRWMVPAVDAASHLVSSGYEAATRALSSNSWSSPESRAGK